MDKPRTEDELERVAEGSAVMFDGFGNIVRWEEEGQRNEDEVGMRRRYFPYDSKYFRRSFNGIPFPEIPLAKVFPYSDSDTCMRYCPLPDYFCNIECIAKRFHVTDHVTEEVEEETAEKKDPWRVNLSPEKSRRLRKEFGVCYPTFPKDWKFHEMLLKEYVADVIRIEKEFFLKTVVSAYENGVPEECKPSQCVSWDVAKSYTQSDVWGLSPVHVSAAVYKLREMGYLPTGSQPAYVLLCPQSVVSSLCRDPLFNPNVVPINSVVLYTYHNYRTILVAMPDPLWRKNDLLKDDIDGAGHMGCYGYLFPIEACCRLVDTYYEQCERLKGKNISYRYLWEMDRARDCLSVSINALIGYFFKKCSFNEQQTVPIIRLAIRLDRAFCAENTPCVKQEAHGSKGAAKK